MLKFLDIFFIVFHTAVIIFNLFGWIIRKLRIANLVMLLLTAFSWFVLGIFYGIGYCPLTDWHFKVLERLGYHNLPTSYIKYMIDRLTGGDIEEHTADTLATVLFFAALFISLVLNISDYRTWRLNKQKTI